MDYIRHCPVCGYDHVNYYYDTKTIECPDCGWVTDMEVKREPDSEKKQMDVLYICNRERCEHCTWPVCQHTTDIKYAANFVNEDGYWKEVVKDGEEGCDI